MRSGLLLALVVFLVSCKKQSNCVSSKVDIETNSPVVEGWPLNLLAFESLEYLYEWSGPNGFNVSYDYYSSTANKQVKMTTSFADAGTYTLKLRNREGCVEYEGSVEVAIIAAPEAPCSIPVNTSTPSILGVGSARYRDTTTRLTEDLYDVQYSSGSQTLVIRFSKIPRPGIYNSTGAFFPFSDETVGVYILSGTYEFVMNPGFKIYVTRESGQLYVSFCNCSFSNPLGTTPLVMSGRVKAWG